jgi:acylphosphatase
MAEQTAERVRLEAVVRGQVQGVGYRFFAQREAAARGLPGYTRNLPDGAVEVVAEGRRSALEDYLNALRRGPSAAIVEGVEQRWGMAEGTYSGFSIRHV